MNALSEAIVPASAIARPTATILVCDDDRLVLVTLSAALRSAGYSVIEAENGDEAILLARQYRPDLAVLDIRMDGKSGLDVAAYLRDYVGTPFMFLSAFSDEAFIRQAREFGAIEYLVKPIDIECMAPVVARALALRSASGVPAAGEVPASMPAHRLMPALPAIDARQAIVAREIDASQRRSPVPAVAPRVPARDLLPDDGSADRQIAVGILMERFRLTRLAAEQRLGALARQSSRTESETATELVRSMDSLNTSHLA